MASDDSSSIIKSLDILLPFIESGRVIPVVSNSFRIEEIFKGDSHLLKLMDQKPQFYDEVRTYDQQLTKSWAYEVGYPMSDDHNVARVSQYLQVTTGEPEEVVRAYFKFLVTRLLELNEKDETYKDTVAKIRALSRTPLFSEVTKRLEYPRFGEDTEDPLRLLARLPLKIYITTGYSNFLERALELEKKTPRTQLCFSMAEAGIKTEHLPDGEFTPTVENPAVVHLFGLEDYANSVVLSEDDHINFLMNAAEDKVSMDVYPEYLRTNLADSRLLLIGYNLHDWEFRTLIRLLSRLRRVVSKAAKHSIAIQFRPELGEKAKPNEERLLRYMEKLFTNENYKVKWSDSEKFIFELWESWKNYTQGQL